MHAYVYWVTRSERLFLKASCAKHFLLKLHVLELKLDPVMECWVRIFFFLAIPSKKGVCKSACLKKLWSCFVWLELFFLEVGGGGGGTWYYLNTAEWMWTIKNQPKCVFRRTQQQTWPLTCPWNQRRRRPKTKWFFPTLWRKFHSTQGLFLWEHWRNPSFWTLSHVLK